MKPINCVFLTSLLLVLSLQASGQTSLNKASADEIIGQVCSAAGEISSMQCDFKQIKHLSLLKTAMVSNGRMYYKEGKFLRWEYTEPYRYIFILNGDAAILKSSENTERIDVGTNKMFGQIARTILNSINGSSLAESDDFEITISVENGIWIARLIPIRKELGQLFESIILHINPESKMVTSIELREKSGDNTEIEMYHVELNGNIDESLFH